MKRKEFYDNVINALTAINARLLKLTTAIEKEKVHAFVVNVSDSPKKTESENEYTAPEETASVEKEQKDVESVEESSPETNCFLEEFQPFEVVPGTVIDNTMIDATEDPELDVNAENG